MCKQNLDEKHSDENYLNILDEFRHFSTKLRQNGVFDVFDEMSFMRNRFRRNVMNPMDLSSERENQVFSRRGRCKPSWSRVLLNILQNGENQRGEK